jgi:hypothetical protein
MAVMMVGWMVACSAVHWAGKMAVRKVESRAGMWAKNSVVMKVAAMVAWWVLPMADSMAVR